MKISQRKLTRSLLLAMGAVFLSSTVFLTACGDNNAEDQTQSAGQTQGKETTGQYVSSSLTTAKIKGVLLNTPNLNSTHITVTTQQGVVTLDGSVDSSAQSQLAQKTVEGLDGVSKVENNLTY